MVIYIEYAFVDNLVINSMLLSLTNKFLKLNSKKMQICISALLGTIIALICPLFSNLLNILAKLILMILMPLLIINRLTIKKLISSIFIFFLLTMLFIGFCLFICYSFNLNFISTNNGSLIYNFPIGLALFLSVFIYYTIKNLIKHFYLKKHISNFIYKITFFNENNIYSTNAFLDTGNFLSDNQTNKPISLINFNTFVNLFPNINITNILLKNIEKIGLKNAKYINVGSIGKTQDILIFEVTKIELLSKENKLISFENTMLGLSLKNFSENLDAECILNYKLFYESG